MQLHNLINVGGRALALVETRARTHINETLRTKLNPSLNHHTKVQISVNCNFNMDSGSHHRQPVQALNALYQFETIGNETHCQ